MPQLSFAVTRATKRYHTKTNPPSRFARFMAQAQLYLYIQISCLPPSCRHSHSFLHPLLFHHHPFKLGLMSTSSSSESVFVEEFKLHPPPPPRTNRLKRATPILTTQLQEFETVDLGEPTGPIYTGRRHTYPTDRFERDVEPTTPLPPPAVSAREAFTPCASRARRRSAARATRRPVLLVQSHGKKRRRPRRRALRTK